ncbi:NUDIX hydrolase [Raineya orbicola]|uniref:NUDIX domain n=1 Tax=Raineya orbicola TaxID=2016530 RepID=A0A2N3IIR6_9BACT|nr:CoA pyrophosphatase [Raineya orbicola]PKQ70186.1 NUDIX domain [Raineya orbicola]
MFFTEIEKLAKRIASGNLPGKEAQIRMVSDRFKDRYFELKPNAQTREGAVLILLYPENNTLGLPLILRPEHEKGVHSGQAAFPGGKKDETDKDFIQTALREAQEEVNLDTSQVKIVGQISPLFIFASNFMVYPTVAYVEKKPILEPNPTEVAEIFFTNIEKLKNPATIKKTIISTPQYNFETPYFDVAGKIVWGATAMMLSELIALID